MENNHALKYIDEQDRCYGLTGMAMSVVVLDGEELLASIDMDAPATEMMKFTPQYYFAGNPRLSARLAWNHIVQHYQLTMGMIIGNVLSRCYVHRRMELTPEMLSVLHDFITEEGKETCQLEDDEINNLFNKQFAYMQRLFRHHGVQAIVDDFALQLRKKRSMSINEIIEGFQALQML